MHESQGRAFLTASVLGAAVLMVAACTPAAPAAAPTAPPAAAKPTTAPAAAPTAPPAAAAPTTAAPAPTTPPAAAPAKPEPPKPDAAQVQQGQMLVAQKGCGGCHTIPGVAGATATVGPNLAGVATRSPIAGGALPNNGPDDLKKWVLDPPALKPGTQMPKLGLTDAEATAIVAFLETLR
jgi:cytochrome c